MELDSLTDLAPAFVVLLTGVVLTTLGMRAAALSSPVPAGGFLIMTLGVALTAWTSWRELPRQLLKPAA
jgi:hypothetical protein